jgi:hypothetical protein
VAPEAASTGCPPTSDISDYLTVRTLLNIIDVREEAEMPDRDVYDRNVERG